MHKHRKFRHHGPRHFHGWGPFHGAFWWIGLAILFYTGEWWPGILILMGVSMFFGAIFRDRRKDWTRDWSEWSKQWDEPPAPPREPPVQPPPAPRPVPATEPVHPFHRADLLPVTCSQCGGPIRSYEVKWKGERSAACPYCGSILKMKKE